MDKPANNLTPGTVIIVMKGKTEQRWQITGHYHEDQYAGSWYAARRWVKKNARWSSNDYMVSTRRIVRVESV